MTALLDILYPVYFTASSPILLLLLFAASLIVVLPILIMWERVLIRFSRTVEDAHKPGRPMVPRPAGPAILLAFVIVLAPFLLTRSVAGFLMTGAIALLIGLYDDLRGLGGIIKPALSLLIAVPLILLGVYNYNPHLPFIGSTTLTIIYPLLMIIGASIFSNASNMMDVYNGVLSSVLATATVPLLVIFLLQRNLTMSVLSLVYLGVVLGFFFRHRYPSKIFPGDSGSLMLGAMYFALVVMGQLEIIGILAFMPLIFNGFFIITSVRGFREHKSFQRPVSLTENYEITANKGRGLSITLVRLLTVSHPLSEKDLALNIWLLSVFSSVFALIVYLLVGA